MANPNLTLAQAKLATRDTMRKIQMSLDTTIESWNAAKLSTRDFRTMAERPADISGVTGVPQNTESTQSTGSVSDYVRSLNQ